MISNEKSGFLRKKSLSGLTGPCLAGSVSAKRVSLPQLYNLTKTYYALVVCVRWPARKTFAMLPAPTVTRAVSFSAVNLEKRAVP